MGVIQDVVDGILEVAGCYVKCKHHFMICIHPVLGYDATVGLVGWINWKVLVCCLPRACGGVGRTVKRPPTGGKEASRRL